MVLAGLPTSVGCSGSSLLMKNMESVLLPALTVKRYCLLLGQLIEEQRLQLTS